MILIVLSRVKKRFGNAVIIEPEWKVLRQCRKGDLVLIDFGAEYANYAGDVTRTVPVNGRFTKRQKQVYNAVLNVQKAAINLLVPGKTLEEYHRQVGQIMESELIGLGLLDPKLVRTQSADDPLYKQYFPHGTSHFLGLDVHDYGDKYRPLEAGMVLTCEPGISRAFNDNIPVPFFR